MFQRFNRFILSLNNDERDFSQEKEKFAVKEFNYDNL